MLRVVPTAAQLSARAAQQLQLKKQKYSELAFFYSQINSLRLEGARCNGNVTMASRFVGSMSSPEQKLWFPNQNYKTLSRDMWNLSHLLQLKQDYQKPIHRIAVNVSFCVSIWISFSSTFGPAI